VRPCDGDQPLSVERLSKGDQKLHCFPDALPHLTVKHPFFFVR